MRLNFNISYLGGVSYIIVLIGAFTSFFDCGITCFIGFAIAGITWFSLGKSVGDTIFKVNGIFIVLMSVVGVINGITLLTTAFSERNDIVTGFAMILSMTVLSVLGLIAFFFHLFSHLRVGKRFGVNTFKLSAICQVVSVVLIVLAVGLFFVTALLNVTSLELHDTNPVHLIKIFGVPFMILLFAWLVSVVSYILSAVSFFSMDENRGV